MANTSKGRFPSYGLVRGPSHSQGGVPASVANGPDVELEGGEFIIPKEAVPDYLPVLQQITQVGRDRQQMQNGNTAIDALIASASMQNGIAQPKSPVYQEGGRISNFFKKQKENFQRAAMMGEKTGTRNPFLKTAEEQLAIQARDTSPLSMRRESPNISLGELEEVALVQPYRPEVMSAREQVNMLPDEALEEIQMSQDTFEPFGRIPNMPEDERGNFLNYLFGGRDNLITTRSLLEDILGLRTSKQQGGMVQYEDGGRVLAKRKLIDDMSESNGVSKGYSRLDSETLDLDTLERVQDIIMERNIGDQYGGIEDALVSRPGSADMGERRTYANRFDVRQDFGPDGNTSTSREQLSVGSLPVLAALANLASRAGVSGESALGRVLNASLPIERITEDGRTSFGLSREQGGMIEYEDGGEVHSRRMYNQKDKKKYGYEMGGMVNRQPMMQRPMNPAMNFSPMQQRNPRMYQDGGQVQTRKQQEMRNPELYYGPPVKLMGPGLNSYEKAEQEFEAFMDSLQGNQDINPFTGEPIDTDADKRRLKERMKKSKIPRSSQRMPMEEGGQVQLRRQAEKNLMSRQPKEKMDVIFPFSENVPSFLYPDFIGPRTPMQNKLLERFLDDMMRNARGDKKFYIDESDKQESGMKIAQEGGMVSNNNLMGSMASDQRIAALQPDIYQSKSENGVSTEQRMEVPKLAEAILPIYGLETPLSKNQGSMLRRNNVPANVLNPQVKGLINRVLVQRLSAESN